jgi:NAD(P)-dependent dehydrogenase (short-subunit alcohol dehydrogenase family)
MKNYLDDLFGLENKVAVITGGTGLLGRVFVKVFLECGTNVVFASTDKNKAEAFVSELKDFSSRVLGVRADVSKKEDVKEVMRSAVENFGRIDILVNNAGIAGHLSAGTIAPSFEDYPREEWDRMWAVNVTGSFLCAQEAGKEMAKTGGGSIINISSIYGMTGPDQRIYEKESGEKFIKPVSYSAAKGAILSLTKYLAAYWGDKNIRVNALVPGGVFNNQDPEFVKKYSDKVPLGRMAKPDDLAGPVLFLGSEASSYMTGAFLIVDGGWLAW